MHAPCVRKGDGAGRSPDLRVPALLRLPGLPQWHCEEALAAHSCGGSSGVDLSRTATPLTGFPLGRPRPGDGTPTPATSERAAAGFVNSSRERPRDRHSCGRDLIRRVVAAEAEADAVAAHVGDDVCGCKTPVDGLAASVSKVRKCPRGAAGVTSRACCSGATPAISFKEQLPRAPIACAWIASTLRPISSHPVEHGGETVKPARVEGRAEEARAVVAVGDAALRRGQRAERREPAGVARPQRIARRTMHEAGAFARHRVFVAARKIEGAPREPRRSVGSAMKP